MVATRGLLSTVLPAFLDDIGEHLVHLADLRRDAVVDSAVANFDDKAAEDIGLDLYVWGRTKSAGVEMIGEDLWEQVRVRRAPHVPL